jgi:capsular polysaccharide biosynthesis protein
MSDERFILPSSKPFSGPPSGYFVVLPASSDAGTSRLGEILAVARRSWKLLLTTSIVAAGIGAGVSLQMRNVYRAQTVIAPVTENSGGPGGSLKSQLGGIAALAGIDVGDLGARKAEYLATLNSAALARAFIADQNMLPIMYADRWDASNKRWRNGKAPPMDTAIKKLANSVVIVVESHTNGLVTVSGEWYSPELAARWANRMVEMTNDLLRAKATLKAERSIEYLNKELAKTTIEEIRQGIYHSIEEQINDEMLANVQREYAYHVIDPAVPPDVKFSPKRTLITAGSAFGGLFIGLAFALARRRLGPAKAAP